MQENIKYWVWLSRLSCKVRLSTIYKLLEKYKTPKAIWELEKRGLLEKGCSKFEVEQILKIEYRQNIENYIYSMEQKNIKIITLENKLYPENLKKIYDPPVVLYAKGDINILNKKSIAIVGCRNCSNEGKDIAQEFGYKLSKNNIVIVSGMAKGIDTWAHIGCINASGQTIAILGSGIDVIYPKENRGLYEKISKTGIIISEYIIGTKVVPANFPRRNRIISGLSNGVLVVEAKQRSGSLITADLALEEGKEIYAIPGDIKNPNSKGTNNLIKQGAKIVTDVEDILEDML